MSPISRLPAELLGVIFVLVDGMADSDQDRLSVMLCCKHWRHIAIRTPELWATIRMGHGIDVAHCDAMISCSAESRVRTSLERAGTAALNIILEESSNFDLGHCSLAVPLLLTQSSRWHSFKQFGSADFKSPVANGAYFKNLVHLSINNIGDESSINPLSGKICFSQLKYLKLTFGSIWEPLSLEVPLLTELDISTLDFCFQDIFLDLLSESPLLESIRVSNGRKTDTEYDEEPHAIVPTLARLREMSINNPDWLLPVSKPIIQSSPVLRELGLGVHHLIGNDPPLNPLLGVATVIFYFGIPLPDPAPWSGPRPTARSPVRKTNARKWLEVFPRASAVRIVDEIGSDHKVNPEAAVLADALLLLELPSLEHQVLLPNLQHLIFENVKINFALKKLLRFMRKRTWVRDGGTLKPGSRGREDPDIACRVTLKDCGDIESVEQASLKELEEHLRRTGLATAV